MQLNPLVLEIMTEANTASIYSILLILFKNISGMYTIYKEYQHYTNVIKPYMHTASTYYV